MDLRGFGKKDKRTWFYTSKAKREDFIALFAGIFIYIKISKSTRLKSALKWIPKVLKYV
jgi:energy-coupling factor transporter transmembrane protein EcfT